LGNEVEASSQRQILRSSFLIGGSSLINVLVGLLRIKVVAILLGPSGVGLLGILNNTMSVGAAISGLGVNSAATRQVAEANSAGNMQALAEVRRVLLIASIGLAFIGGFLFWFLRNDISKTVLDNEEYNWAVGWLAFGLIFTVISAGFKSLLTGMRMVPELAKVTILSALISTVVGGGGVYFFGDYGIVILVIAAPLSVLVMSFYYMSLIDHARVEFLSFKGLRYQWGKLFKLGLAFMVAGLAGTLGDLVVKSLVQKSLGMEGLGYFQASWIISMTYVGFVLAAMGTDYYPQLSSCIRDKNKAESLVNDQSEIAILLAGPIILMMLSLAPWIIQLLYSKEFFLAAPLLKLLIFGDVLRVISWPLGFVVIASGKGKLFVFSEVFVTVVFVLAVWFFVDRGGLEAIGFAFILKYIVYVPVVYFMAKKIIGFSWSGSVKKEMNILIFFSVLVGYLSSANYWLLVLSVFFSLVVALRSVKKISEMSGRLEGWPRIAKVFKRLRLL